MSSGTGFVLAAYLITLATLVGYGIMLVVRNRAATRRLEQGRAERGDGGDPAPADGEKGAAPGRKTAHV